MGVDSSKPLPKHFTELTTWPRSRIEAVLKSYNDGDYDFGIDYNAVMNITGLDVEQAATLHKAHLKNDSGVINVITLLITIISLGDSSTRNEIWRLETIFDLLDFNRSHQISCDELSILLLCAGSSFSFIMGKEPAKHPQDARIIVFANSIYETLGKKYTSTIKKEELVKWCKDYVFGKGAMTINDILNVLIDGIEND